MAEQILYSFCESLVRRQAEAERVMLEEFRKGTYTIEKPFVKINPYLINPLAAVVMFMTEEETAVTVTVYGKEARGNIVHTFPPAKEHILPVLGLYADCHGHFIQSGHIIGHLQHTLCTDEEISIFQALQIKNYRSCQMPPDVSPIVKTGRKRI